MTMGTNSGFVARELNRRAFQETVATVLDKQAEAIQALHRDLRATREFMADLSKRLDQLAQTVAVTTSSDAA